MARRPLLTIGMIFKNEIRCLERCLRALQPLRDAIPCELVMADTGSGDGSREIAARYADILFDFPWINDFSAARNAVMDRASGMWYLTVDADEYLDPDISQLVAFLQNSRGRRERAGTVYQRNYTTREMDGNYSDFSALRLLDMSLGLRYKGAIHEAWMPEEGEEVHLLVKRLDRVILHHDGYVGLEEEAGRAKRERNVQILRRELEVAPDDLRRLQQFIESGKTEPDFLEILDHAVKTVQEKKPGWELYGPPIFRYAVVVAVQRNLPGVAERVRQAEEWFPDSYYTRIDVSVLAFGECWNKTKDYSECIRWGEKYLAACAAYEKETDKTFELFGGPVSKVSPVDQSDMRVYLATAYLKEHQPEKALDLMEKVDFTLLDQQMTGILTQNLLDLHARSLLDTAPLVRSAWEGLTAPVPHRERADERRAVFYQNAAPVFAAQYRSEEIFKEDVRRPAYTALLPLTEKCTLGVAAAILKSREPAEAAALLGQVERWNEFPASVLAHVVQTGAPFPPPGRPLRLEELDELAGRLAREQETFTLLLERAMAEEFAKDLQTLSWVRALVLAGVQACKWESGAAGMALVRQFARAEAAYLPRCYTPEVLTAEGSALLPPLHRFGWYCVQAFDALNSGDAAAYARLLRRGLTACEGAKAMAEFLLEHTPELQAAKPSPELLALAEQVRTMLAAYTPDDPAVAALKASPLYREVAYLIEGAET